MKAEELLIYLSIKFEGRWEDIYSFIKKKEKPPPLRNFFVKVVTNFYNVLTIFEVKNRIYKYSINIGFLSLFSSSFLSIKDSFLFFFLLIAC